jgi:hypothetical protein
MTSLACVLAEIQTDLLGGLVTAQDRSCAKRTQHQINAYLWSEDFGNRGEVCVWAQRGAVRPLCGRVDRCIDKETKPTVHCCS